MFSAKFHMCFEGIITFFSKLQSDNYLCYTFISHSMVPFATPTNASSVLILHIILHPTVNLSEPSLSKILS